jgi:hypothetical protein
MAILYEKDWDKYPDAIVHTESRNESWVKMAAKYRTMGVKHWYMMLALIQPELAKWDPFDPNLPEHIVQMMMLECEENPWYFFREIQRVPAKSGGGSHPLRANRGNIAMFWCVMNSFITYVQQIRQTGKSLNTRAVVNYFHNVAARDSMHILFTKGDLRKEEIKEYKLMRDLLPKWMWYLHPKDADNQHEFTTLSRGNRTKSYVPQGDPEAANGVGRGTTPTLVTGDEVPFLPYAEISIPSLIAATTASFDEARANGSMHGILYTTTAGDLSTDSGKYVFEKIKSIAMFFSEILYDCVDRKDAVATIRANSKSEAPYVDISFNHLQLGYSDEWLREKIATVPASRDKIRRDYLGQWTFGSASNPIKEKILNKIRKSLNQEPITDKSNESYIVRYHVPKEEALRRKSVLGLDTSNAVGRDSMSGIMVDIETGEVLLAFSVSESNLIRFSMWFSKFMQEFKEMTVIPEAKSTWITILDYLLIDLPINGVDPGRRIYSRVVDRAEASEAAKRDYREYSHGIPTERKFFPYRSDFGFPTSGPLREALYIDIMPVATETTATMIRDASLIDELSTLVERRGRIDHASSGHDDHVISWLMTHWFLRSARNLDHYGINTRSILSRLRTMAAESPQESKRILKEEKLLNDIYLMEEKIDNSKSHMERKYLETKLKVMKSELKTVEVADSGVSIDKHSDTSRHNKQAAAKSKHRDQLFGGFKNNMFLNRGR